MTFYEILETLRDFMVDKDMSDKGLFLVLILDYIYDGKEYPCSDFVPMDYDFYLSCLKFIERQNLRKKIHK